jgi:hypothetical protein
LIEVKVLIKVMGAGTTKEAVRVIRFDGVKPVIDKEDLDKGRYFEPTVAIAWLIGNSFYDKVRAAGKENYKDIEQAP